MKSEFLIGGATRASKAVRKPGAEAPDAQPVGFRFLGTLVLASAVMVGLGAWRVHTVFRIRDFEMETRRLQELAQQRRDRMHALESRLSQISRGESLRQAGLTRFGMADPEPVQIERIAIPKEAVQRWNAAAASAGKEAPAK